MSPLYSVRRNCMLFTTPLRGVVNNMACYQPGLGSYNIQRLPQLLVYPEFLSVADYLRRGSGLFGIEWIGSGEHTQRQSYCMCKYRTWIEFAECLHRGPGISTWFQWIPKRNYCHIEGNASPSTWRMAARLALSPNINLEGNAIPPKWKW